MTSLTDNQIEELKEILSENQSEKTKILREVISDETATEESLEAVEVNMVIDPDTGEEYIDDLYDDLLSTHEITLEDIEAADISDFENLAITEDMLRSSDIMKEANFSDQEVIDLLNLIEEYELDPKADIYNRMPSFMKKSVDELFYGGEGQITKKEICKIIMDNFIKEIKMDQAFLDINTAIKNELKLPSLTELYSEYVKENFEEKLIEIANEVKESDPEKAETLENISRIYKTTYTFEELIEGLNNRKVRQYIRETKKYNKMCNDFNRKYEKSLFKITSVKLCLPVLKRCLPDIEEDYLKKFIMLFCKVSENKNPSDINDHVFMYYTIQNIRLLHHDENDETKRSEMYNTVTENIIKVIDLIKEKENNRKR